MINPKLFLLPIFLLVLLFASHAYAQDITLKPKEPDSIHWQINAILNPFVGALLTNSGDGGNNNPFGIQWKRYQGNNAMRWNLEYDRIRSSGWGGNAFASIKEHMGDSLRLVSEEYDAHQFRLGMGFERGRMGKFWRRYSGIDVSLTYRYTRYYSQEWYFNISEGMGVGTLEPEGQRFVSAAGLGIKPFIGIERPLNERWGINLEGKLDFIAQYSEGHVLLDDGRFLPTSGVFDFASFPLLEARLYYNF